MPVPASFTPTPGPCERHVPMSTEAPVSPCRTCGARLVGYYTHGRYEWVVAR